MTNQTIPIDREVVERALKILGAMSAHRSQFAERDFVYEAIEEALTTQAAPPEQAGASEPIHFRAVLDK